MSFGGGKAVFGLFAGTRRGVSSITRTAPTARLEAITGCIDMTLTKHADYSIRVLMYLAARPGKKIPITAIADAYDISRNHLMKVSQNLARHGFIIGYRGKGGGITLARPADDINLGQVLAVAEPNMNAPNPGMLPNICPGDAKFHQILDAARKSYQATVSSYTLAELVTAPAEG